VLVGTEVMYVEIVRSRNAPRMPSEVGGRLPAHASGVGKAMLAYSPEPVVQAVLATGLPAVGPRTITAPGLLLRELRRIRELGIAYESEESGHGIGCAASPILGADGTVVAAMSISGWSGKLDLRRIGPAVKTAALAMSRDLAIRGPAAPPAWSNPG
jgi:DNA-binding IclR family transcriptional regulator